MENTKIPTPSERGKAKYTALDIACLVAAILTSAISAACAIVLITSACSVYFGAAEGTSPYSREKVAVYLALTLPVAIPAFLSAITGGVLFLIRERAVVVGRVSSPYLTLSTLRRSLSRYESGEKFREDVKKTRQLRLIISIAAVALIAIFFAIAAIFVCNPARYTVDDINTDIAYSVLIALVSTVGAAGVLVALSYFLDYSYKAECELIKAELVRLAGAAKIDLPAPKEYNVTINVVRGVVLVIAVVFIILGITNGGMAEVFGKAVRICTECIGLG